MSIVKKITEAVWPEHIFDDPELTYHRQGVWYAPQFTQIDDLSPMIAEASVDLDFEDFR